MQKTAAASGENLIRSTGPQTAVCGVLKIPQIKLYFWPTRYVPG